MYKYYVFIGLLGVAVISIVIAGFIISGNPFSEKALSYDRARIADFNTIKYQIENYYSSHKVLPNELADLPSLRVMKDPQTQKEYEYKLVSSTSYQFCTTFSTDSSEVDGSDNNYSYIDLPENSSKHKKGYDCLDYSLASYLLNNSYYVSPTPIVSVDPEDYVFLKGCDITPDESSTAELKIMGIYETENGLVVTANKLTNAQVDNWTLNPDSPGANFFYSKYIFDTQKEHYPLALNKTTGYRIHLLNPLGKKVISDAYIFQGNRTIITDPRCPGATLTPTAIPAPITQVTPTRGVIITNPSADSAVQ